MFETAFFQMGVLFNLEWFALLCALCIVIAFFSRVPIAGVMRIFLAAYILITAVPVLDFIIYFPGGCKIDYLYTMQGYLNALAFFFIPFKDAGVCAGIRIEVFAGFALCFAYVFIRSGSLPRAAAAAICLYFLAISSMAFPVFILLLPALASGSPDSFVTSFFNAPSYGGPLLNRIAVMIFMFMTPLLLVLYGAWRGREKLKGLALDFVKHAPLIFACAFICGFLTAPPKPGQAVFDGSFDYALLLSGIMLSLLFGYYHDCSSGRKPENRVFEALPFLLVIASAAMNHSFFFISLFILSASAFMRLKPFELSRFAPAGAAYFALCGMMMYLSGFSAVAGPFSLRSINPVFVAAAGAVLALCHLLQKTAGNSLLSSAVIAAFTIAAFGMPRPVMLLVSVSAAIVIAAVSYRYPPSGARNALLSGLVCLYFIAAGLSGRP